MRVSSLPKTVTRQRRSCDLNPGPSAPESSTLTTRLPSGTLQCPLLTDKGLTGVGQRRRASKVGGRLTAGDLPRRYTGLT